MREIKFRLFDKRDGSIMKSIPYYKLNFMNCEVDDYIIMQYTGLKDKNGKEIYEHDIVKCHYFYEGLGDNLGVYEAEKVITGEITITEFGIWVACNSEQDSDFILHLIAGLHEESFEVIGNIYENPELL